MSQPEDPTIRAEIAKTPVTNWLRHLYLFIKDRELQWVNRISPLFKEDTCIILDRYWHSSCVHQGAFDPSITYQSILKAHGKFLPTPHITFLLVAPDEIIEERLAQRTMDDLRVFEENKELRQLYRRRYLGLLGEPEFQECVRIDASKDVPHAIKQTYLPIQRLMATVKPAI